MSNRLNQEREAELQPIRMKTCKEKLESLGYQVKSDDQTKLTFIHDGAQITFWPYSGWHTGRSIKDGRGFNNLIKQLEEK